MAAAIDSFVKMRVAQGILVWSSGGRLRRCGPGASPRGIWQGAMGRLGGLLARGQLMAPSAPSMSIGATAEAEVAKQGHE
jgi:hypothetical protein